MDFTRTAIDQLGKRLCQELTESDIRLLDGYRKTFRTDYDDVVETLRANLVEAGVSGRPEKSTSAIVSKLRRGSMRLSQMQDIAGCRLITPDIAQQDQIVSKIAQLFPQATVKDRRRKSSYGYRAVHVIVRRNLLPIEIQVRTFLQHVWAEISEKFSDMCGPEVKYGGGPENVRSLLHTMSDIVELVEFTDQRDFEKLAELQKKWRELQDRFKEYP
jgi:ppGpp synthetase/RelA/SpoT-type nucleotidyltranferase